MNGYRYLHMPQLHEVNHKITCMKDGCPWTADQYDPKAQESFEAHLRGE